MFIRSMSMYLSPRQKTIINRRIDRNSTFSAVFPSKRGNHEIVKMRNVKIFSQKTVDNHTARR